MKQILILKENVGVVKNSNDLYSKIKTLKLDYQNENFLVFYLNCKNKFIGFDIVSKGIIDSCIISPSVIFRNAIKKNAFRIITAHNHPSEDLTPSYEDIGINNKIKECGELLQIELLDSVIFNKKEFYSIKDRGDL